MKRLGYWLPSLLVLGAACGGSNDTNSLRTQVAALQTQVAQPTPTATSTPPPPTGTATPTATSLPPTAVPPTAPPTPTATPKVVFVPQPTAPPQSGRTVPCSFVVARTETNTGYIYGTGAKSWDVYVRNPKTGNISIVGSDYQWPPNSCWPEGGFVDKDPQ